MPFAVSEDSMVSDSPLRSASRLLGDREAEKLLRVANLAEQFGHKQISYHARLSAERVAEARFYVACVGQFKRGKSTLLNALVGRPILPSGVTPVTSVPTILRFGETLRARVRSQGGDWTPVAIADIEQYVSEKHNPENCKGVAGLEVFLPSPLLAAGMCLVDTPGLGSVFAGNTAATHDFLPHVDAAIVLTGADPPISRDELALVETLSRQVSDLLFILNKADRVTGEERATAIAFTKQVIEDRLQRSIPLIFEVSALEQLNRGDGQRDWTRLMDALEHLVEHSGRQLVRNAADRSLRYLSAQLLVVIEEERLALIRPMEESEERIRRLRETASQAEQSINDLGPLFAGEERRLSMTFVDRRNTFLKSMPEIAHQELGVALQSLPRTTGPRYRRGAMKAAQCVARRVMMPWLESEQGHAQKAYQRIAIRFADLANDFLLGVRGLSAEFAVLPEKLNTVQGFRTRSEFHFQEFIQRALPASPIRYVADLVLGLFRAHSAIDASAHEFLDLLLETNSERVRNDLEQRVGESKRSFEAEIRSLLRELGGSAERALCHARSTRAGGARDVESALKRLADEEAELTQLTGGQPSPSRGQ